MMTWHGPIGEHVYFPQTGTWAIRIVPGLFRDPITGTVHVDIPELLEHFGYQDTPENRDVCTKAALAVCQERYPRASIQEA